MTARRFPMSAATLVALCSAWIGLAGNLALWRELHALGLLVRPGGWLLAAGLGVAVSALVASLLALAAWPRVLKPAIGLALLATAAGMHFMLSYHVVVDPGMIVNVLQTDRHEALGVLGPGFAATLLWAALVPALLVWRTSPRFAPWPRQLARNLLAAGAGVALAAAAVLAAFQPLAPAMRNHKHLRYLLNPLNTVWALSSAAAGPRQARSGPVEPLGRDAQLAAAATGRPPLLVLVLGETARAANLSINGYARPTTPELERQGAASFGEVASCGTSTATSVPCMFSHLGRAGFGQRDREHENLLDVLQHAGLAVLWLENQAGCKGVCDRVPHARTEPGANPQLCPGGECLDAALLAGLDARLAALPRERRERGVVLVLHQMGSHGPAYAQRSPASFKRFQPECGTVQLQDCSREELLNAYDNSIAYTDHVLGATIGWLRAREREYDTALVYVSDHGESLGENNLYLHGMPYALAPDVQKRVPWITWLGPAFERRGVRLACLRGLAPQARSHDHYFHSVLGLLQVQTAAYRRDLDAYAPCMQPPH